MFTSPTNKASRSCIHANRGVGFSIIELLAVIAIIAILAGLALSALAHAKGKAHEISCLNNKKQLQLGWQIYVNDNGDKLPPNGHEAPKPPRRMDLQFWWARGEMDYEPNNPDNTDIELLSSPKYALLATTMDSPIVYRCPSDRSKVDVAGRAQPRVRSVSMNSYLGGLRNCMDVYAEPSGPQLESEIRNPSETFVFIDEHPDSISFIQFWVDTQRNSYARLLSYPGTYHNNGTTLSFADGHVEAHRWRDSRTILPIKSVRDNKWPPADALSPDNLDVQWLQNLSDPK